MVPWAIPGVAKLSIPILNLSIGPVPGNREGQISLKKSVLVTSVTLGDQDGLLAPL